MKWNLMLGAMVAVGLLGATEVWAQETAAQSAATGATPNDAKAAPAYGTYVNGPSTVDADGVPVAEPNAISDFQKRSQAFDGTETSQPLVDDPRTDSSASGQTK